MTGRKRRRHLVAVLFAVGAAICILYALVPLQWEWLPQCPLRRLTGYLCPGCGSQTALQQLLRGNISAAWHANAFIFIAFPAIVLTIYADYAQKQHRRMAAVLLHPATIAIWLVVILLWTVVRNLS